MSILNIPKCTTSLGNTGVPDCTFDFGKIRGAILIPRAMYFTPANMVDSDTFLGVLQAATVAAGSSRIYPLARFKGMEDKSTEATINTSGYGEPTITDDGLYNFVFDVADGGVCYNALMRRFNGQAGKWKILFYDDKNQIRGTADADGNLYGLDLSILHTHKVKMNNGTDPAKYMLEVALPKPEQLNDNVGIVPVDFDVENDVLGILDVELYVIAQVAGKATIGARFNCGKTDLYADLATLMAAKALWTVKTSAGVAVVISDVVKNDTDGGWDVTFTGTGAFTINWASPATLVAAHVGEPPSNGLEAIAVVATLPAP